MSRPPWVCTGLDQPGFGPRALDGIFCGLGAADTRRVWLRSGRNYSLNFGAMQSHLVSQSQSFPITHSRTCTYTHTLTHSHTTTTTTPKHPSATIHPLKHLALKPSLGAPLLASHTSTSWANVERTSWPQSSSYTKTHHQSSYTCSTTLLSYHEFRGYSWLVLAS